MNYMVANQEFSSGCESGWTLYLEENSTSSISIPCNQHNDHLVGRRRSNSKSRGFREAAKQSKYEDDDDEDEDLSMVSDASSGPRPYNWQDTDQEEGYGAVGCFYDESSSRTKKKKIGKDQNRRRTKAHHETSSSLLHDTASSPFLDFSNNSYNATSRSLEPSVENVMSYSQGYSTTQFEVRPGYQEHYDFNQASTSGNQLHQNHRWVGDNRW